MNIAKDVHKQMFLIKKYNIFCFDYPQMLSSQAVLPILFLLSRNSAFESSDK